MTSDKLSRRTLGGLAAAGVGVPLLAASASDNSSTASDPAPQANGSAGGGTGGGEALAQTADIEVGGGQIFADQEVVVTQPKSGEFKCFTAICTHQGCLLSSVSDGTINCDCHGSQYSIENGEVEQGPATFPLDEVPITVSGDSISLA
jgi:Rieske Fe-S protein